MGINQNLKFYSTLLVLSFFVFLLGSSPVFAVSSFNAAITMAAVDEAVGSLGSNSSKLSDEDENDFAEFDDEFGDSEGTISDEVYDPLITYNRFMFNFNDKFYEYVLRPSVRFYGYIIPEGVRISVGKFFHNLFFPLRFVNSVLQLKFQKALAEVGRFAVNSTIGLLGLFDPAARYLKWHPSNEDFGQTLAFYGVGEGFPIIIPFLGPSNLRDGVGILPEYLLHPITYVSDDYIAYLGTVVAENFNFVSLHYKEYDSLKKDALDPYTFMRDTFRQRRLKLIKE